MPIGIVEQALQMQSILEYYEALDCPRALTCWLLFTNNEHSQLVNLDWNPSDYEGLESARDSLAATKFLSKATFLKTGVNLKERALEKFYAAELQCFQANLRLRTGRISYQTSCILTDAKAIIYGIIGEEPNLTDLLDSCNWGNGASVSIKKKHATAPNKFQNDTGISALARAFVSDKWLDWYPHWDIQFTTIEHNRIDTVPKNAKTDRIIAIEPGINLWFQKGCGRILRRALSRVGIDLSKQRHNQEKARVASILNDVATVDFSMASDTVSLELVRELLPKTWFRVLSLFRSRYGLEGSTKVLYSKFSSMGNGFTFELETLIFYALAKATCKSLGISFEGISVYGDDVILPSAAYDLYEKVTSDCGFTINKEKSYKDSPYRESCGEHFWLGHRIKPVFLKEPLRGKTNVLKFANSVRRYARRRHSDGCDRRLRRCWLTLAKYLGPSCPRISEGYGDVGLIENIYGKYVNVSPADNGYEGYLVSVWSTTPFKRKFDGHGLQLTKLKKQSTPDSSAFSSPYYVVDGLTDYLDEFLEDLQEFGFEAAGIGNLVPLPGRTKHAKIRVLVPQWVDLGEWL